MTQTTNPWVSAPDAAAPDDAPQADTGPVFATPVASGDLFLAAAHGGAGVSTLLRLAPTLREVRPRLYSGDRLVVVCRSNVTGLQAAQRVLAYLATPAAPRVVVEGLLVSSDAPGRPPRPIRDLVDLLSGAAPRTWRLPWVEAWRYSAAPTEAPRAVRAVLDDLTELADGALPSVLTNRKA